MQGVQGIEGKHYRRHPTRTYPWGVIALVGDDHSILDTHHVAGSVWFRTRVQAGDYAKAMFQAFVVARATFPRAGKR